MLGLQDEHIMVSKRHKICKYTNPNYDSGDFINIDQIRWLICLPKNSC